MNSLLQIKDLHVSFSSQTRLIHAVRGVTFDLMSGETLGIVGESGSGKSALSKALLRLTPQTTRITGQAIYQNKNLLESSEKELQTIRSKQIAIITQDSMTALNPTTKIGTQLIESYQKSDPAASYVESYKLVCEMLRQLQLSHVESLMQAYAHQLSGGMRQRILIAHALIRKPQVLIADEPTTALDEKLKHQVLSCLKQQSMCLILISHDLKSIAKFCDRIIVMYAGRIVESAPADQLMHNPQHPYTKGLIHSLVNLETIKTKPLNSMSGQPPDLSQVHTRCAFCTRCQEAMTICTQEIPPFYKIGLSHTSACFKHDSRKLQ